MHRRTFLGGIAGGSCALLAGCSAVFGARSGDYDVGMRASAFVPSEIEVTVGDTVAWYNDNDRPHTVTAYENSLPDGATFFASGDFETETAAREGYDGDLSGAIYPGERYEHTFEAAGEFEYFCVPHERRGMTGTIVVSE